MQGKGRKMAARANQNVQEGRGAITTVQKMQAWARWSRKWRAGRGGKGEEIPPPAKRCPRAGGGGG